MKHGSDESGLRCSFELICSMRWDDLAETDEPDQRHCGQCDRRVYRISSPDELARARAQGRCVAVESIPAEALVPDPRPEMTLGMVAPQPRPWVPAAWVRGPRRTGAVLAGLAIVAAILWWWL